MPADPRQQPSARSRTARARRAHRTHSAWIVRESSGGAPSRLQGGWSVNGQHRLTCEQSGRSNNLVLLTHSYPPAARADSTAAQRFTSIPRGASRSCAPEFLSSLDRRPPPGHLGSARITAVRDSSPPPDSAARRGRPRRARPPSAPAARARTLLLASGRIVRALVRLPVAGWFKARGRARPTDTGSAATIRCASLFANAPACIMDRRNAVSQCDPDPTLQSAFQHPMHRRAAGPRAHRLVQASRDPRLTRVSRTRARVATSWPPMDAGHDTRLPPRIRMSAAPRSVCRANPRSRAFHAHARDRGAHRPQVPAWMGRSTPATLANLAAPGSAARYRLKSVTIESMARRPLAADHHCRADAVEHVPYNMRCMPPIAARTLSELACCPIPTCSRTHQQLGRPTRSPSAQRRPVMRPRTPPPVQMVRQRLHLPPTPTTRPTQASCTRCASRSE